MKFKKRSWKEYLARFLAQLTDANLDLVYQWARNLQRRTEALLGLSSGQPHPCSGLYVVSYDPNYHLPDGSYDGGHLETTTDPARAYQGSQEQVFLLWRFGPSCPCHRLRSDGQPNRPLTAFNASIAPTPG